jgi:hypothetical protein
MAKLTAPTAFFCFRDAGSDTDGVKRRATSNVEAMETPETT